MEYNAAHPTYTVTPDEDIEILEAEYKPRYRCYRPSCVEYYGLLKGEKITMRGPSEEGFASYVEKWEKGSIQLGGGQDL